MALSEADQAKIKLLRLFGNKKKREVLNSEMQKYYPEISLNGKFNILMV